MKKLSSLTILLLLVLFPFLSFSQGSENYGAGIKIKVNDDGTKFIRLITWHQFWTRYTEANPNTSLTGEDKSSYADFGLRRSRFLVYAQVTPRFLILSHWGINNQTYVNGGYLGGQDAKRPQLYIHDAWAEHAIVQNKLHLGAGLHYWNGISRITNGSTLNFMAVDAPIFNWATIETTDQFARQFGMYAKGQIGKLDYRVALNRPFTVGAMPTPTALTSTVAVNIQNSNWATQGYLQYQFWEAESNLLPFAVGTYVGKKKVFNIGAGWYSHPESMGTNENGIVKKHDTMLFGLDAFMDLPLNAEKGTALTAYGVWYNYDFGPNNLRNIGIMNIGYAGSQPATASFNGAGNAQPTIGTGNIGYLLGGYLFPKSLFGEGQRFQIFSAYTYKKFDRLVDPSHQFDAGCNLFLEGHHAKITLQYSNRPIYNTNRSLDKYLGEFILQTMIYL